MTKRASPFELDFCRQSKIHINNYENDLSVLNNMKELTFKKLMDGSKKLHSIILNNEDNFNSRIGDQHQSNNFFQKCITNYFTVNGKKINESDRILVSSLETLNRCFFCDFNCSSLYQCIRCRELYCPSCSFVNYESFEDKRICLSCS